MAIIQRFSNTTIITFVLALALLPALSSASGFQEGIHFIRPDSQYITNEYAIPEYLTVEDITFVSCLEEDYPLRNSLLCIDDNKFVDLPASTWSNTDNCYVSSYNLEDFECKQLVVQAEYTKNEENLRMTKTIRVNKLSKVLDRIVNSQYSDGGWQDPLSTTYAVWALSYFKDIYHYELDLALDWLKMARNEEEKCWPQAPCSMTMSSNILALLTLSNYTDARRVVNDARNWLEQKHNYYDQGDEWTLSARAVATDTTLALVASGTNVLDENFTLPYNDEKNYSLKAYQGGVVTLISDDHVFVNLYNEDGGLLIEYQGDNLSYTIPGACWSTNMKGEPCDIRSSLFAMVSPIDEEQKEVAQEWSRTALTDGRIVGSYIGDEQSPIDTALYVYNNYDDDEGTQTMKRAIDWVLYTQNNEGSWYTGTTEEKAIPTAYAVLSLMNSGFNRSSEPVIDAEEWVSKNEDNISSENTQALSSAFTILKHHSRPVVVAQPKILVVDKQHIDLELLNPTTFHLNDLTYEFSPEVENYLSIDAREELAAYSYRKLSVSLLNQPADNVYGFLVVKNLDDPVARIPVIITDTPILSVSVPETFSVFGRTADIPLTVQKSPHEFVCTAKWSGSEITTPGSFRIRGNTQLPVQLDRSLTKEDVYSGTLECTAAGTTITLPVSLYLQRFSSIPLTVQPTDVIVNSTTQDVILMLKNELDRDVPVTVQMDRYGDYFSFRTSLVLNPNEEQEFVMTNLLPVDMNITSSVLVTFSFLGRTETVSLLIDIEEQPAQGANLLGLIITLVVILAVVGGLGFFVWKFRDVIFAELNKLTFWRVKEEKRKESMKIKTLKVEEQHQAIVNMFNIMKLQGKDDKDIAAKLLQSFSREEVRTTLASVGAALPVLDEEEPERVEK